MKTVKLNLIVAVLSIVASLFYSCQKNDIEKVNNDLNSEESSAAEDLFDDAFEQAEMYDDVSLKSAVEDYCIPAINIDYPDNSPYPRIITLDFGTEGCTGKHGRVRTGKIISILTDPFTDAGSKRIISFDNYSVNGYQLEGTKTIINNGKNDADNPVCLIEVNGKVTTPDGHEITCISTRLREWIEGYETPLFFWDDVFLITGNANGNNSLRGDYQIDIISPLRKARNCGWIQEGIIQIVTDEKTIILDYGDRQCNNDATLTVNGVEREIRIRW